MPQLTYSLADFLKVKYPSWRVLSTIAKENPAWAMAQKQTDGGATSYNYVIEYSIPNRAAGFAAAQNNAGRTRHAELALTFADDFGVIQIEQKLIEGAKNGGPGGADAFVKIIESQTQGVMTALNNSLGRSMFGDGSGSLGTIAAGTNLATTTLGLAREADIVHFYVGMELVFAATTAAALRSATNLGVTAVNEEAATITLDATPNSLAAGIAVGDQIFTEGDYATAGARSLMRGFGAWIPLTAPAVGGTAFFGFDRGVDPTGLAGYRFADSTAAYAGYQTEDAIRLLGWRIARGGGVAKTCFADHERVDDLIKSVGSKEEFCKSVPVKMGDGRVVAELGFDGVKVRTASGVVEVFPDRSCSHDTIWVGDMEKVKVISIGEAPHWITDPNNSNRARTMDTAAAVECRLAAWPQMAIKRPKSWGRFDWT